MGPTVWELEGPIPTLNKAKTLIDTVLILCPETPVSLTLQRWVRYCQKRRVVTFLSTVISP